jgi:hypothetical protein
MKHLVLLLLLPFSPLFADDPVIGRVYGREILLSESNDLSGIVLGALLDQYRVDQAILPAESDIRDFVAGARQQELKSIAGWKQSLAEARERLATDELTDEQRAELETNIAMYTNFLANPSGPEEDLAPEAPISPIEREIATAMISSWMVNRSLYRKYGGRLIFQQFGIEPLDAYRKLLEEQHEKGSFEIAKGYEALFWNYFTNDAMHMFYGDDDGRQLIDNPWWLMEETP